MALICSCYGWVVFHCVNVPRVLNPFICGWTSRLFPCLGYCRCLSFDHELIIQTSSQGQLPPRRKSSEIACFPWGVCWGGGVGRDSQENAHVSLYNRLVFQGHFLEAPGPSDCTLWLRVTCCPCLGSLQTALRGGSSLALYSFGRTRLHGGKHSAPRPQDDP